MTLTESNIPNISSPLDPLDRPIWGAKAIAVAANLLTDKGEPDLRRAFYLLGIGELPATKVADGWVRATARLIERGSYRASGAGENEWQTPAQYIAFARQVLGDIDIDPATSDTAQKTVRACNFHTKADDGLAREWRGRVLAESALLAAAADRRGRSISARP